MFKQVLSVFAVVALVSGTAFAQSGTSVGEQTYRGEQTMRDEVLGFSPQVGVVSYTDAFGDTESRALTGIQINWNLVSTMSETERDWYAGLSTGGYYSHLGGSASNFFGSSDAGAGNQGANMVLIPTNAKIGYNFTSSFRGSVHGGGNLIYRSQAIAAVLGDESFTNDSNWKMFPNVGADLEWQVGEHVSVLARPDLTFAPGNNMFVATLGATFMPEF